MGAIRQRLIQTPIPFGIGHGPVDAITVAHAREPGEGLGPVMSSAEGIKVRGRGRALRPRVVMIKIAALGGHGAGGEAAGAGADHDRFGESAGGEASQFGGVEEPAAVVGEQPGEQDLVAAGRARPERLGDQLPQLFGRNDGRTVGQLPWRVVQIQQAGQRHDDTDPHHAGLFRQRQPPERKRCRLLLRVDRRADRLVIAVEALPTGAEQLSSLGVDVFDFEPAVASAVLSRRSLLDRQVGVLRGG